jgi:hypothetical protein
MKIVDPGGNKAPVSAVWVYLVRHGPGDESVAGFHGADGWMPMVASTDEAVVEMAQVAQMIASRSGKPLILAKFEQRTDIARIMP